MTPPSLTSRDPSDDRAHRPSVRSSYWQQIITIAGVVSITGGGLLLAGTVVAVGQSFFGWPSRPPVRWFDLNAELSAPAWYSSIILAACSFLAALSASGNRRNAARYWWATSAVLLFMSADEAISVHEHLFRILFPNVALNGPLTFDWVVIGFPLAAIVGGLLLPLLWKVPRRTATGIVASGAIYLMGALGIEMVGAWLVSIQHPLYPLQPIVEEGMEIGGLLLLLWTLLTHLERAAHVVERRSSVS